MTHFPLYMIKVWVTVACSHAAVSPLYPDAAGLKGENDIRALMTATGSHTGRNKHSQNHLSWPDVALRSRATSPTVPLGMQGDCNCSRGDHQLRHRWQIYRISVSLSAFKAPSYGCREPAASFLSGGKDQGKGQSTGHNDLILSQTVMRYCSLRCWEEDKECHARF